MTDLGPNATAVFSKDTYIKIKDNVVTENDWALIYPYINDPAEVIYRKGFCFKVKDKESVYVLKNELDLGERYMLLELNTVHVGRRVVSEDPLNRL